jgi:hypothetical protein
LAKHLLDDDFLSLKYSDFFNFHFHPSLSAFRKGFGCHTALLKIIEDWKKALDENKYIAAILMDLSTAFDFQHFLTVTL